MKSHLSYILPVWQACEILGEPVVRRMVYSLLHLRHNSAANQVLLSSSSKSPEEALEQDVEVLTQALFYRHTPEKPLPAYIAHAWKRWLSARNLALDKATLIQFVVPHTVQPHSGPSGHMGMFDCWVYALQGHGVASSANSSYYGGGSVSNTLVWLPDVIIMMAASKNFCGWTEGGRNVLSRPAVSLKDQEKRLANGDGQPTIPGGDEEDEEQQEVDSVSDDGDSLVSDSENGTEVTDTSSPQPKSSPPPVVQSSSQESALSVVEKFRRSPSGSPINRKSSIMEAMKARQELDDDDEASSPVRKLPSAPAIAAAERAASPPTLAQTGSAISAAAARKNLQYESEDAVRAMSLLSFRIYDSYQKKGIVARDTIHRFMTDVHGEDSFKEAPTKALLDQIFETELVESGQYQTDVAAAAAAASDLQATVSEIQFVQRILETFDYERRTHLLLDWVANLIRAMVPTSEIAPSVNAYLDTMERRPKPLCEIYQIAESRLFEVKRRFHSLVRSGPALIQGDPMGGGDASSDSQAQQSQSSQQQQASQPKHTISQSAFLEAVCQPNEEMGHGGYLPNYLAELVFVAGSRNLSNTEAFATPNSFGGTNAGNEAGDGGVEAFWGLANLIQFGCTAVRRNSLYPDEPDDLPVLKFLFSVFSLGFEDGSQRLQKLQDDEYKVDDSPQVLNRPQVERMLLLMVAHMEFRLAAESPLLEGSSSATDLSISRSGSSSGSVDSANPTVDGEPSYLLGLLPPKMERPESGKLSLVPLQILVDYALESTADGRTMTFEEFRAWNSAVPDGGPASRLLPITNDLRLISSVLFGIPPTQASLEISLIAEIERRHKARYPQTSVSRRGPRGTIWYIIDAEWLRSWAQQVKEMTGTDEDADDGRIQIKGGIRGLGRIENAGLLFNSTLALRQDIQWKHDYEILPPLAWHALQAWYDGGPPIHRSVVRYVDNNVKATKTTPTDKSGKSRMPTENEIELYPYFVTVYLCDAQSGGESRPFQQNYQLSRVSPVGAMLVQLCKELDVEPDNARLWVLGSTNTTQLSTFDRTSFTGGEDVVNDWILNLEQNIVDQRKARLDAGHTKRDIHLLLELQSQDTGQWPRGEDGKEWVLREKGASKPVQTDNLGDGIVGLYNMGNTCFLNSSIQCISHTPIFREYFTSKAYLNDINKTNPMGYEGQLAQVSAVLINSLWKPFAQNNVVPANKKRVTAPGSYVMVNAQSLTPKTFKESLGKFNELFSGNEQHDAQELLTFLLAGLSEDLNRIVDKPYIEAPDSDGRPDKELADIWWANHLKRELSIVVALFNGQYKNLLTCRTCKYESARFEPFSTLTVPLPEDDSLTASVILYPFGAGKEPTRYCVRARSSGNLGDVLLELAKLLMEDETSEGDLQTTSAEPETSSSDGNADKEQEAADVREGMDPKVVRKARDLVIVDMRDGYIHRIAPLSWQLHDLQNKDTGDLPTMHAYELGDFDDENNGKAATTSSGEENEIEEPSQKSGYLAISQRRSDLISRDYLHPLSHKLFGTPILLRLTDMEKYTGTALYDTVAQRLRPLVPKGALRFLTIEPPRSNTTPIKHDVGEESWNSDFDEPNDRGGSGSMTRSMTDSENISAGPVPRYGFRLRVTSRDGRRCLICPWYRCCVGCLINDDDSLANVMDGDSIVVDWHFAVDVATLGFGLRSGLLDPIAARPNPVGMRAARPTSVVVKTHKSCGVGGKGSMSGAITLENCLDAFAKEERIPEAFCSKCKEFRVQTTRMTLWRLPPVLIIHLKRFQFTPTMRRKLRDLVVFPLEGLDLSRIMAQGGAKSEGINKVPGGSEADGDGQTGGKADTTVGGSTKSTEPNQLYDLYGVIHHQGALSGGHYVASLKSELDGQWRLFNDAQIYEIHARDVIDASAYILFYMRRDVAERARLADFWDLKQVATLNEEEMDNLVKGKAERCVIQ